MTAKRTKAVTPLWRWQVLAAIFVLAITLTGAAPRAHPLLVVLVGGALIVGLFLLGVRAWRGLDEVAREAQKTACMWGARIGAGVNFILVLMLVVSGGAWLPAHLSPQMYVVLGIGASALPMIVAYQIYWSVWWLKRR